MAETLGSLQLKATGGRGSGAFPSSHSKVAFSIALDEKKCLKPSHVLDFGFGKSSMSTMISDEALEMVNHLSTFEGKDFLADKTFNIAVVNILWQIVSGQRFQVGDIINLWHIRKSLIYNSAVR